MAGIWAFTAFLNGSQAFVSFDTPDSEFHASMSIYAGEVTDRVAVPVYYWTRLGHIAPAHVLTELLGPVAGLQCYRAVLIAIIVTALYVTLRTFTGRFTTAVLTTLVAANTVLLAYLGNPYPTATAIAALFALVACVVAGKGPASQVAAGGCVGWLAMTSPYALLLGLVMFVAVLVARGQQTWSVTGLARRAALGLAGAVVVFGALLMVGRVLFPGLDWLQTYRFWNSVLHQEDYIFDLMQWTRDPSLLVPAFVAVAAAALAVIHRRNTAVRIAAALAVLVPAFAWVYWWRLPNNYLEIPHYQAMFWPAALIAVALLGAGLLPDAHLTWPRGTLAAGAVVAIVAAGHSTVTLGTGASRLLAVSCAVLLALALTTGGRSWVAGMAAIAVVLAGAQVLQNARGTFGVSTDRLYSGAYAPNEAGAMLASEVAAHDFVLAHTTPGDRALTWVDADWGAHEQELVPMAAYGLWGVNEAARGVANTEAVIADWDKRKPLSVVMYGKTLDAVLGFWNSIPKDHRPSIPDCKEVPWPATGSAQVCVTHLQW